MNVPHNPIAGFSADHPLPGARGFMDYNEGDVYDGIGRKVQELIMKTNDFIVFIDEYGSVQWGFDSPNSSTDHYNAVSNRVAELETRSRFLRVRSAPKQGEDVAAHQHALFSARRLIAEGMARQLSSDSLESAQGILDTADKWIAQRSLECSRSWLLIPFGSLAAAGLLAFFILVLISGGPPENGSPQLWLLGALLGGVGALISNVSFNRKIPFDATAGRSLHWLEAALRWMVGISAGLAAQLLIQGNVMLGFLADAGNSPVAGLVLSLLAGLSELFFPTLLRQFDQSVEAVKKPIPADAGAIEQPPSPTVRFSLSNAKTPSADQDSNELR